MPLNPLGPECSSPAYRADSLHFWSGQVHRRLFTEIREAESRVRSEARLAKWIADAFLTTDCLALPQGDLDDLPGTASSEALPTSSRPYDSSQFALPHANGHAAYAAQPHNRERGQGSEQPGVPGGGASSRCCPRGARAPAASRERRRGRRQREFRRCVRRSALRLLLAPRAAPALLLSGPEVRSPSSLLCAGPPRPPLAGDPAALFAFPSLVGAIPTGPPTVDDIIYRASVGDTFNGLIAGGARPTWAPPPPRAARAQLESPG